MNSAVEFEVRILDNSENRIELDAMTQKSVLG